MTDGADRVLRDLAGDPSAAVVIEDGTEHFRSGAIRLMLRGDGHAEVEHRRASERKVYEADLPADRVAATGRKLADLGFLDLRPPDRPLTPDESLVELTLRRGDETLHSEHIPFDESYENEGFEGIVDCFMELVFEVTDGALPPKAGG